MLERVGILVSGKQNIRVLQQLHPDHVACTSGSSAYNLASWTNDAGSSLSKFDIFISYKAGLHSTGDNVIMLKVKTCLYNVKYSIHFLIPCSLRPNCPFTKKSTKCHWDCFSDPELTILYIRNFHAGSVHLSRPGSPPFRQKVSLKRRFSPDFHKRVIKFN